MFDALIKVGGSVCHSPHLREYASRWAALAGRYRLLFMAGGGLFADQVRVLDQHLDLNDDAAHWMAIAAMEQNGYLLADLMPGIQTVQDFDPTFSLAASGSSSVLLPYSLLRQVDPLPHSWEVTSDSLAAWLAGFAGIKCLILLKDVPGVYATGSPVTPPPLLAEVTRQQLAQFEVVDPFFVETLPGNVQCWIIDGREPERLAELLQTGKTAGTRIN